MKIRLEAREFSRKGYPYINGTVEAKCFPIVQPNAVGLWDHMKSGPNRAKFAFPIINDPMSCEITFLPENQSFPMIDGYYFHVQIVNFSSNSAYVSSCAHKLTLVNLLGDEIELFTICATPVGYFTHENFTLRSHGTPEANGSIHLILKENLSAIYFDYHSEIKVEARKANGDSLPDGRLHISCTMRYSREKNRIYTNFTGGLEPHGQELNHWPMDKTLHNAFKLKSPRWSFYTDADKLMCKLKFQPHRGENDANIIFRIWVKSLNNKPVCGYKLYLVNMLRNGMEVRDYCDDSKNNFDKSMRPEFSAVGNLKENGSVSVVFEKTSGNDIVAGRFCLVINVHNGTDGFPLAHGDVSVSCHRACIKPKIDNGYLTCTSPGNNGSYTCEVKCIRHYSIEMEPTEYACDGDDWNPPFSSEFISNACKPRPEMCNVNGTINNAYVFTCTGAANELWHQCALRCAEGYHYNSIAAAIPVSIALTCNEVIYNNIERNIIRRIADARGEFECVRIRDCNCSAKTNDDYKAVLQGQLISASGGVKVASEQENLPVWITVSAGVSAGLMIIIGIVILYVARRSKHPSDNHRPLSANESAATLDTAT